ncbi:MAG: hypothetical protein MUF54_15685 [Polyangiaceae bacterium]|jgi:hypothetical protein|nr:hypothetical protein [Polyangiaceae bacterium]
MVNDPPPASITRSDDDERAREQSGKKSVRSAQIRPPVLASEALREDIAPLEPWRRTLRYWVGALGLVLLALAASLQVGLLPASTTGARVAWVIGIVVVLAAALPVPYPVRGVLVLASGASTLSIGLVGEGPLAGLVTGRTSLAWELAGAVAATVLSAALLFRSRYRAYGGARVVLILALVLALPATVQALVVIATGPLLAKIAAGLAVLAVLTSLLGFMGEGTTAASTAWAIFVLMMFAANIAARSLWLDTGWSRFAEHMQAAGAFLVACTLASIGLFQLLATALAREARRVDVLRKRRPSVEVPGDGD